MEDMVRILAGVSKEHREIIGDGFVDPLIAITGPANDIAPPLVSGFVKRDDLGKEFLGIGVEAGATLSFGREEGVGGDVEESWPTLPERAGNLRDGEMTKREGARILFEEMYGGINVVGQAFEGLGRAWGRGRSGDAGGGVGAGEWESGSDLNGRLRQLRKDSRFELFIGVDIDGMIFGGNGSNSVFSEIEPSFRDGLFRLPVGDAEFAVITFLRFFASGDKAETFGPAQGHIVDREFGGVSVMGEPAVAFAHVEDGVSSIFDDVATITKIQSKGCARRERVGEKDTKGILAAVTQFFTGESFVLEKSERSSGIEGNGCDLEGTRKLKEEELRSTRKRAKIDRSISIEGVVGIDGGVDVIAQGSEVQRSGRKTGKRVGSPDVVRSGFVDGARLPDHEIFRAQVIGEDIERTGDYAIDPRMEKMPGSGGEYFKENAKRVRGIQAGDIGLPGSDKRGIGRGVKAGVLELSEEIAGGVIRKTNVGGDELLVKDRRAEKAGHLLLFRRIVRKGKDVTEPRKNESGDATFKRSIKGKTAFLKGEDNIAMTDFDAILGREGVNVLRIRGERVEGSENFTGRESSGRASDRPRKEKKERGGREFHQTSVVIFSMEEQGPDRESLQTA
jgi:hypothetical protein